MAQRPRQSGLNKFNSKSPKLPSPKVGTKDFTKPTKVKVTGATGLNVKQPQMGDMQE